MTRSLPGRSPARLTRPISAAKPGCQGQPDRAEPSEPRSGALDRPAQRSYAVAHAPQLTYHPHRTPMTHSPETGRVNNAQISEIESDTPHFAQDVVRSPEGEQRDEKPNVGPTGR
jgi:hypothetical protein